MVSFGVLRKPAYLALTVMLTVVLSVVYYVFSLRGAGVKTTLLTTHLQTPAFQIKTFGPAFFYGGVALDIIVAFLTAVLIALTLANYRAQRRAGRGSACSVASFAVAATTFGCPACVIPLAGTLGVTLAGGALPFLGLEFKALALLVLIGGLVWMTRAGRAVAGKDAPSARQPLPG